MTNAISFHFAHEEQMFKFGQKLALALKTQLQAQDDKGLTLYLNGELGAGKTTLTRSIVRAFGHQGNVKSPTYTLVEEYQLPPFSVYHFDLYRLADPEEIEFMGIRDYFQPKTLCLLEWASKGEGMIAPADIVLQIDYAEVGRNITLIPQNATGEEILVKFQQNQTA